jgi:hypothetical protein
MVKLENVGAKGFSVEEMLKLDELFSVMTQKNVAGALSS